MDIFSRDDLEQLASAHGEHCLSIYMPTHQATEAVQQDPTRLKNLITEAEGLLAEAGLRVPDGRDFLQPVRRILADEVFWQHQSDGLAIFVCEDAALTYRLPLSFDDLVVLTDRFHIKPLFPLLSGDGRFYERARKTQALQPWDIRAYPWL